MEYKAIPQFTKAVDGRSVSGIFAVHGNIDEGNDRSWPGAFANLATNGRARVRFVWQHRMDEPPTAVIKSVREVGRGDLPASVLSYAPEATGGVEVVREYLDTPRGNEVLAGVSSGAIEEMSYSYDPIRFDFEEIENRGMVRNLREVKLYDISDVLWGMNAATTASKGLPLDIEHQTVHAAVVSYTERLKALRALRAKEGRVLSGENRKRIEAAIEALDGALLALKDLLAATEPKTHDRAAVQRARQEWQRLKHEAIRLGATVT